jgi:aryl-alcohol dehydrogenase
MKCKAAIAREGVVEFGWSEIELAEPRADEILVRIAGVGLCHTDLIARDQFIPVGSPAVLGHEGAGEVVKVGSEVTKVVPGNRVALSFRSCGTCRNCGEHRPSYCEHFVALNMSGARPDGSTAVTLDGKQISSNFFGQSSFAEYALAYESNIVRIEDANVPIELLGPLGCGIQTGAGGVMRSLACPAGSSLLIVGGGSVGLAAVMGGAVQRCATIIVVEPHGARRELALELGATHAIDPIGHDVAAAVREILPSGVEYAFDTTGRPDSFRAVFASLASRGHFGMVSAEAADTVLTLDVNGFILAGHHMHGIIEGDSDPDIFIPELVALYKAGRFPYDRLVTTYPLSDINRAIADQHAGRCIKAVLIPDDGKGASHD